MSAVLGYQPAGGGEAPERIWLEAPGTHCLATGCKEELLAALQDMRPPEGARLFVLGADVAALPAAERAALLASVGFVPAGGGLLSSLNAWENIVLPVSYHAPHRLPQLYDEVRGVLEDLGGVDEALLGKLPEEMSLYERRLCAYVRALLEKPRLLLVESLAADLGPTKRGRAARFADTYHERCPGGTYVELQG
jgi:ABC-type lipoprotein export system ATPase subunit